MGKTRILIISLEVWRDGTNGGNVLSNILGNLDAEFAQIYCSPGEPCNSVCKRYYQMTDHMAIKNLLNKQPMGKVIYYDVFPSDDNIIRQADKENKSFYDFFRRHRLDSFIAAKEWIWAFSKWKNQSLEKFILDFNPDIIFAPCYGNHFMLNLTRYVAKLTKKTIISYISDDSYTLAQFRISPVYWVNRLLLRRNLRKTFPYYSLVYTMTEEQKVQCEKAFSARMKILRKGGEFSEDIIDKPIGKPIRLIYAGGIYCGRWKTLVAIAKALGKINKNGIKITLDIYTGNQLTGKQRQLLNDGKNSFIHELISQDRLREEYKKSDIALHVESFQLKYKLLTKLSFSTKIVDCLESTCAVMAICWDKHSGYIYLKKEDAAICLDSVNDIERALIDIVKNPRKIREYREKARDCGIRNHKRSYIQEMVKFDIELLNCELKNK